MSSSECPGYHHNHRRPLVFFLTRGLLIGGERGGGWPRVTVAVGVAGVVGISPPQIQRHCFPPRDVRAQLFHDGAHDRLVRFFLPSFFPPYAGARASHSCLYPARCPCPCRCSQPCLCLYPSHYISACPSSSPPPFAHHLRVYFRATPGRCSYPGQHFEGAAVAGSYFAVLAKEMHRTFDASPLQHQHRRRRCLGNRLAFYKNSTGNTTARFALDPFGSGVESKSIGR